MSLRRRALLRALGLGAVAAPWVPLLPSHAEEGAIPRRLLLVHFAHGVARDHWSPVVEGGQLSLSPILAPLQDISDRLIIVEGLDNAAGQSQVGDPHNIATGTLLTAMPLLADLGPGGHYLPGGISIDQRLAPALAGAEPVPWDSVQLGVRSQGFSLAARGEGQPLRAEDDPVAAHARLFGELGLDPVAREYRHEQRTRARDLVRRRLDELSGTLPAEDREHLDAHRHSVEALQARLDAMGGPPDCSIPEAPPLVPTPTSPADADVPTLVRAQTELVVAALACDLTRVMTVQWGSSGNDGLRHVWQGIEQEFHSLVHLANGEDTHAHERLVQMNTWTMGELAHLLTRLGSVPQGEGTLLDHTVVVCLSSLSVGHEMGDLPVVLAGGGLPGDRHLVYGGTPLAALWMAVAEHLGSPLSGFGDPEHDVGALPGLF